MIDKGLEWIEKQLLEKIDVNSEFKRDRKRLTLIDKGQNEIEKGRLKKRDVNRD